jgi:hypothetical protein
MDDDVKQALDDLRGELKDLARTRAGTSERRTAERDAAAAREDLEDVLRREGYRLSRRELDRLVDEEEERRFNARLDKALADRAAADEDDDENDDAELDEDGKPKPKPKGKPKPKPKPATEEEEWT